MKEFGELKGYQGDINNKALVDYAKWMFRTQEEFQSLTALFWSHDAGEISQHLSEDVMKLINEADGHLSAFSNMWLQIADQLLTELEITDREGELMKIIFEYLEINDFDYNWDKYIQEFTKYHTILENLTEEDEKFIAFWRDSYE